jgi:hypothetical protein
MLAVASNIGVDSKETPLSVNTVDAHCDSTLRNHTEAS